MFAECTNIIFIVLSDAFIFNAANPIGRSREHSTIINKKFVSGGYGASRRNINCCIRNFRRCWCLGRPRTGGVAISSGQEVQAEGRRPGGPERQRRGHELHSAPANSQEERVPQSEDSAHQHEGPRVSRKAIVHIAIQAPNIFPIRRSILHKKFPLAAVQAKNSITTNREFLFCFVFFFLRYLKAGLSTALKSNLSGAVASLTMALT